MKRVKITSRRQALEAIKAIRQQAEQGTDQDEIGPVLPQIEGIYRALLTAWSERDTAIALLRHTRRDD